MFFRFRRPAPDHDQCAATLSALETYAQSLEDSLGPRARGTRRKGHPLDWERDTADTLMEDAGVVYGIRLAVFHLSQAMTSQPGTAASDAEAITERLLDELRAHLSRS